jgi:galactonate dehydratase
MSDRRSVLKGLPRGYNFKDGRMWPNDWPGLGVEVDVSNLTKLGEYATYRAGMLLNIRPDGSFTNW